MESDDQALGRGLRHAIETDMASDVGRPARHRGSHPRTKSGSGPLFYPSTRTLSRREALAALGGAAILAGVPLRLGAQALPACIATPAQMEGPFFTDARLDRSDIRSDPADKSVKEGVPLALTLRVSSVTAAGCVPLPGAMVDIWQCDAAGAYSDSDRSTAGKRFLRGYQMTDGGGAASFTTIYPGWYPGRAVHIHFKVRVMAGPALGHEFTSQLYFDDAISDRVFTRRPYSARGKGYVRNNDDGLFRRGGTRLLVALTESRGGYAGEFSVGIMA
jgi:protocatechuate 3,4-dioxygenase beta subunit